LDYLQYPHPPTVCTNRIPAIVPSIQLPYDPRLGNNSMSVAARSLIIPLNLVPSEPNHLPPQALAGSSPATSARSYPGDAVGVTTKPITRILVSGCSSTSFTTERFPTATSKAPSSMGCCRFVLNVEFSLVKWLLLIFGMRCEALGSWRGRRKGESTCVCKVS
jgi:hypothetical protein